MRYCHYSFPWRFSSFAFLFSLSTVFAGGTAGPPGPAPAPAKPAARAPAPAFTLPNVSEIIGDRVNVRAGTGINYRILKVATKGDRVIVHKLKNDWAQIEIPENIPLYISKQYLTVDETGKGIVTASEVNVRPAPNLREPPLCQLNAKEEVKVIEAAGDFYKIEPPAKAKAWVIAKYIRFYSGLEDLTKKAEKAQSLRTEFAALVKKDLEEQTKDPSKRDLASLISNYDKFIEMNSAESEFKQLAVQRKAELEEMKRLSEQVDERLTKNQTILDDLQKRYMDLEQKVAAMTATPPPTPTYLAKGRIEPLIRLWNRPGTHKLVSEEGKLLCILISDGHNLEEFEGKEVGINGDEQSIPGWHANLVDVLEIEVLDDLALR